MAYTLTQAESKEVLVTDQTAWSVQLTVTSDDENLYPKDVFVYQTEDIYVEGSRSYFSCVASPSQLEILSGIPDPESPSQQPFFRLDTVTLISRNPDDLAQLIEQIKRDVLNLRVNLDALQDFAEETTTVL